MTRIAYFSLFISLPLISVSCQNSWKKQVNQETRTLVESALLKAGTNSSELQKALDEAPNGQKAGVAYLIAYMPERRIPKRVGMWQPGPKRMCRVHLNYESLRMVATV